VCYFVSYHLCSGLRSCWKCGANGPNWDYRDVVVDNLYLVLSSASVAMVTFLSALEDSCSGGLSGSCCGSFSRIFFYIIRLYYIL
jgi:hypothetical protein